MKTPKLRVLAPLLGACVLFVASAASAAGPLLAEYTIFGENGVVIGFDSDIKGLVGARNEDPVTGDAVRLQGQSTVDGDVRSGGDVNLQNQASVSGSVIHPAGTTLTLNNGSSVGTNVVADPMLPTLPPNTVFACPTGGANDSGGNNEARVLTPGSYGALNFGGSFDLTLNGAGNYFFDSITAGNGSTITVTQPGTKVYVCGPVRFGSVNVTLQTQSNSPCDFYLETKASGDNAVQFGGNSNWIGDVFAPNGEIHIGSGGSVGSFIGRFFSNMVDIEHSIQGGSVQCGSPPRDEDEFRSNKDATIFHTRKNQNNGAALTLRVENQTRSLLGFDVSTVNFAKVLSAKLILTVSNNGFDVPPYSPSSNWPLGGGETYVARLDDGFEDWAEGNGNNYPTPKNPKGTGSGVTWNCSTDTNIANEKPDCTGIDRWKTGGKKYQGPLRGPAIQTNDMLDGTKIVFDVTADVQAGLGPQDTKFMSFFIQVKGLGSVAYYSKEGAAAAGNLSYVPMLVVDEAP